MVGSVRFITDSRGGQRTKEGPNPGKARVLLNRMLTQSGGNTHGKRKLDQVGNDEGNDTPAESGSETDRAGLIGIDNHKPSGSERVADGKTENQDGDAHGKLLPEKRFAEPVEKADEKKSENVSAGGPEERA